MLMLDLVDSYVHFEPCTGVTFDATLVRPTALLYGREKFQMKVFT